jgi:hypothetical protein
MPFSAVAQVDEGLSLEALLTLRVENFLICLVGTQRPTASMIEEQLILFLETLTRNSTSECFLE